MAPLSSYSQFETNLMSNRKIIELLLQLKHAKAHGKNYIKDDVEDSALPSLGNPRFIRRATAVLLSRRTKSNQ